jgi:hypothetical protein
MKELNYHCQLVEVDHHHLFFSSELSLQGASNRHVGTFE